ncbi:MAG: flavodoxin family protein [Comamonadaceae bacterium]|nr:MAG: flavodoxin family protein [Comamonadaceae bacterium]
MKTLLIVHHSLTGGTLQMAQAAADAARLQEDVAVRLLRAVDAGPADLLAADGYVFGAAENLAALAGLMKDFFDRCYYPVLGQLNGRPYAAMICAGSDGQNALRQLERIATGWRLRATAPGLIVCTHAQTPERILAPKQIGADDLARCAELGAGLAAGLALGVF